MIRIYLESILLAVLVSMACVGLTLSTSGELQTLAPISLSEDLLYPGLVLVGFLVALSVRSFVKTAIIYGLTLVLSPSLYTAVLAVPGFNLENYSVARFNNGLTESIFVLIATGIFVLIGMSVASAINVYVRNVDI